MKMDSAGHTTLYVVPERLPGRPHHQPPPHGALKAMPIFLRLGCFALLPAMGMLSSCSPKREIAGPSGPPPPIQIEIVEGSRRIDVYWMEPPSWCDTTNWFFEVQTRRGADGEFNTAHEGIVGLTGFSDLKAEPGEARDYRVRTVALDHTGGIAASSPWTKTVTGKARPLQPEHLVEEIQHASFRYFWNYAHPVSGLPREGAGGWTRNLCSIAASGMMFFNIAVGIERDWITREQGLARVDKALTFLLEKADRYYGVFPHWIDGNTGKTIPFSGKDDGADLVESSFLVYGALFFREYIKNDSSETAASIRKKINAMWEGIQWTWFVKNRPDGRKPLLWHWSPNHGFAINLEIVGFNECQVTYLLALASPTHPITPESYFRGWLEAGYGHKRQQYDVTLELGREPYGPPLFFTHYSYMGIHPSNFVYGTKNYFQHFEDFCHVQILWAAEHRKELRGRGIWGLTASLEPGGYGAHYPGHDNGTITPTAILASMPYAPEAAQTGLEQMYEHYREDLWGPFGFYDAMNPGRNWFSRQYIAIDVGPIAPMIENYRTGLGWRTFEHAPELKRALEIVNQGES